jgi:hypothetical protein
MNFRVLLVVVASSLLALGCSERQRIPTAFVGTWQSDEALTLASLGESESASSADIDAFTNDFFGNRVMVYKPYEFTAY